MCNKYSEIRDAEGPDTTFEASFDTDSPVTPSLGDRVKVFWPLDRAYYPGAAGSENYDVINHIQYDDGEEERMDLGKEIWRFCSTQSSERFTSNMPQVLQSMFQYFGNNPFTFRAHSFPSYTLSN